MRLRSFLALCCFVAPGAMLHAQQSVITKAVYDPELNIVFNKQIPATNKRELRYTPDGDDFVIVNGKNKFNRALYGTHTGFRVETGDVPEFALYLPNMGGNLNFSLTSKSQKISLNNADFIESRYRAGSRIYTIADTLLGKGELKITALAMSHHEGMILKIETKNIVSGVKLFWNFGGVANKRFSREGDLGVDPIDAFELKPEYCKGNEYQIEKNKFSVLFGAKNDRKLDGIFPPNSKLIVEGKDKDSPLLSGSVRLAKSQTYYIAIQFSNENFILNNQSLATIFENSEIKRANLASRIKIKTPDPYLNTLGGVLATAADAIWSGEVWLHGAVGWRMPLSGWRAAYTGDVLGWHDRARTHFDAYAASQVTNKPPVFGHPTQDTALNFARSAKVWGTQMYSNGYICRNPNRNDQMHHYDMNLCYIDELLWHLNWTGDLEYARKMWPVLTASLAWEKRNFDPDSDELYDAYACIWASDALYYNSGAVTHSSAYNYRANKFVGELALKLGYNAKPYLDEADKILHALNTRLWLPAKGHWAEFQDRLGAKRVHENAAIWTIYHAIDSKIHNPFQAYQATRYVDTEIPHIPVLAKGLPENNYATIATSNWMPYSWSINNVAFAEVAHTALAYWQAGQSEKGFKLLKSSILDGMYIGASPGNVGQISYYDAARGESYRDFGDPIGITSRAVVQGLFGINPDLLNNRIDIQPGFPANWNTASIETPDINFHFKRTGREGAYVIESKFSKKATLHVILKAQSDSILSVSVNGKPQAWKLLSQSIENPLIEILVPDTAQLHIIWGPNKLNNIFPVSDLKLGETLKIESKARIDSIFDPQKILQNLTRTTQSFEAKVSGHEGMRTVFAKLKQGQMEWWQPISVQLNAVSKPLFRAFSKVDSSKCEKINLSSFYNDSVTNIFNKRYFSPRSPYTTLQIPVQGIGEWCHPTTTALIDDSGLRKMVQNNCIHTKLGVDFMSVSQGRNIAFTSLWDNFTPKISIPLSGKASQAYLLMAGTTNHMQTHFENGIVVAHYSDLSSDTLRLINPENWCPIEQDYFVDGKAFCLKEERPYRLHLKTGLVSNNLEKDLNIDGVYGRKIDGGAAVLLDMPLDASKNLQSLELKTTANEIVIGLMALTLQR